MRLRVRTRRMLVRSQTQTRCCLLPKQPRRLRTFYRVRCPPVHVSSATDGHHCVKSHPPNVISAHCIHTHYIHHSLCTHSAHFLTFSPCACCACRPSRKPTVLPPCLSILGRLSKPRQLVCRCRFLYPAVLAVPRIVAKCCYSTVHLLVAPIVCASSRL